MKMSLTNTGWQENKAVKEGEAQLLWSNADTPTDYSSIKPGQLYNHIRGSFHLTNKGLIHEQLTATNQTFYPLSFLVPKEYEEFMKENNDIAIKKMLKGVSK